jgi:hypothetical protein
LGNTSQGSSPACRQCYLKVSAAVQIRMGTDLIRIGPQLQQELEYEISIIEFIP